MRILILTHERSGGMSLMSWIANEKNFTTYHEPNLSDPDLKKIILTEDNIVVKTFINFIEPNEINKFIDSFDKVIIHKRVNVKDTSLSILYAENTKNYKMHNQYIIDDEWIKGNNDKINHYIKFYKEKNDYLDSFYNPKYIKTTYESVYYDGEDVKVIKDYLQIYDPVWLDMLNNKRRLQNNTNVFDKPVKKRKLI
jgi:hypothetical protein